MPVDLSLLPPRALGVNTAQKVVDGPISIEQNVSFAALQEQINYEEDSLWPRPKTDLTKWDKYCPYQLLVVEVIPNTVGVPEDGQVYRPYKDWRYTFPLPPESLTRYLPFASQLTPTLDGVVEENNGIPIRPVTLRGSTGFLPFKGSGGDRSGTGALSKLEDQVTSIFGGTINTINQISNSVRQAVSAVTNTGLAAYNVYQTAEFDITGPNPLLLKSSGFNQILLLRDFLESYAAIKKKNTDLAKRLRLAFAVWKENDVCLCTPVHFGYLKTASSPLEYTYNISLKCWKRIELDVGSIKATSPVPIRHSPNLIAQALNTLMAARQAVQKIGTLKQAVLGDIDYVFKPFHDTILLCKDTLGATLSVADIPLAVKQRVIINISELKYSSNQFWNQLASSQTWAPAIRALKYTVDDSSHLQDMPVGARGTHVPSYGDNRAAAAASIGYRAKKMAAKDIPDQLADQIPLATLNLASDVRKDVLADVQRVRKLKRKDFEDYANTLRNVSDKIAFLVGAGDSTYAEMYGIDTQPIKSEPTQDDWDTLASLADSIDVMQQFAATADGEPDQAPTMLDRFGDLVTAAGMAWKKPVSKFAIPFPFNATLESLATQYLGDPNRWMEIVALNGLRTPYVDEVGYQLPLLVNGNGNVIVVAKNEDLYVGKTVWLSSNVANRVRYKIEGIQYVNGAYRIKLNEDAGPYKVADSAVLAAFLTGTTCSRNLIWIPSDVDPIDTESVVTKDIPGVDETDPMVSVGGIDVLADNDNNLVLIDGDLRFATGLANIVQWVRLILSYEQGELLQHPKIGLPLSIGLSLADFSAQEVVTAIKNQLGQDPLFSRIDRVAVVQKGAAVDIKINAVVTGTAAPLPLNYGIALAS